MTRNLIAVFTVAAAALMPSLAQAQLAFNAGVVTDYRYRGISQTRLKPAVQGGVDYSIDGFYVGAWASYIKWIKDAGGDANAEIDPELGPQQRDFWRGVIVGLRIGSRWRRRHDVGDRA